MSRRRLALAASPPVEGGRSHPGKKSGGRRERRPPREAPASTSPPVWTELELAFFAAAPPDDPRPAAQPESFDDLDGSPPSGDLRSGWDAFWSAVRRLFARPPRSLPQRP